MSIPDILISAAVLVSVGVGVFRGFMKEAVSIVTLLVAIWAAMSFGAYAGQWSGRWISSEGLQLWVGRGLIFVVILITGGLVGWAVSRLVRISALSGTDRALGAMFGFGRAVLLVGVFVLGGQLANFDKDRWWQDSKLIPYGAEVADWIRVMAPKGADLLHLHGTEERPDASPRRESL